MGAGLLQAPSAGGVTPASRARRQGCDASLQSQPCSSVRGSLPDSLFLPLRSAPLLLDGSVLAIPLPSPLFLSLWRLSPLCDPHFSRVSSVCPTRILRTDPLLSPRPVPPVRLDLSSLLSAFMHCKALLPVLGPCGTLSVIRIQSTKTGAFVLPFQMRELRHGRSN